MNPVPVNEPLLNGNELKYISEAVQTGWISSEGPFIQKFESGMAARAGRKFGVAVSNGSVALDLAVAALDLKPGDEIILPTFTIISCGAAIARAGCMPVPVDCDPETWNMTADAVSRAITPKTKAIMLVHIYGLPIDMDPILELARKKNLKIIEDAAEMHGQTYKGKPCGSFGDVSTFSFYPNKHVTTGEGGMVVVDDPQLAERCRSLRNLCFKPPRRFVHDELGWNFRMTNLQAALGVAQLERLDEFVAKKRRMGALYRELLKDVSTIELQTPSTDYAENIYWVFGVVLKDGVSFDADAAMKKLGELGIGTRPFFWPMHEQPVFLKQGWYKGLRLPVAERIARRGFYLPSGLTLSDDQIRRSADALRSILRNA